MSDIGNLSLTTAPSLDLGQRCAICGTRILGLESMGGMASFHPDRGPSEVSYNFCKDCGSEVHEELVKKMVKRGAKMKTAKRKHIAAIERKDKQLGLPMKPTFNS